MILNKTVDIILKTLGLSDGPAEIDPGVRYFVPNQTSQVWVKGNLVKFIWDDINKKINFEVRIYQTNLITPLDLKEIKLLLPKDWELKVERSGGLTVNYWLQFEILFKNEGLEDPSLQETILALGSFPKMIKNVVETHCKALTTELKSHQMTNIHNLLASNEVLALHKKFMLRMEALYLESQRIKEIQKDNHFIPSYVFPTDDLGKAYLEIIDIDPKGRDKVLTWFDQKNSKLI